jgi:hypothetical protein
VNLSTGYSLQYPWANVIHLVRFWREAVHALLPPGEVAMVSPARFKWRLKLTNLACGACSPRPWTGLENIPAYHADRIASADFLIVPTIRFKLLYVFVILRHAPRVIVHVAIARHPTGEWLAPNL